MYNKNQTQITNPIAVGEYGVSGNQIEIGFGGLEPDPDVVSPGVSYNMNYNLFNPIEIFGQNPATGLGNIVGTHIQNMGLTGWANGNGNIYTIGDETINSRYGNEQDDFASRLQVGTKLRWQNDPNSNVYTVINIEKRFVLRYDANRNNLINFGDGS